MVDIFKKLKKKKQNQTAEKERRDTKTVPKLKQVGNSFFKEKLHKILW